MPAFYDLCLRDSSEKMKIKAEELGWTATNCELETVFLNQDKWGELKQAVRDKREEADLLVFLGGNEELTRKVSELPQLDIILHPEKDRKDSGIDQVVAEQAAENSIAIGFDFSMLRGSRKRKSHILGHWRRNLKLCEKYDAPYIITSGAEDRLELRNPRDLESIINSLGFDGRKAVSKYPKNIVDRAAKVRDDSFVRPGVEVEEE